MGHLGLRKGGHPWLLTLLFRPTILLLSGQIEVTAIESEGQFEVLFSSSRTNCTSSRNPRLLVSMPCLGLKDDTRHSPETSSDFPTLDSKGPSSSCSQSGKDPYQPSSRSTFRVRRSGLTEGLQNSGESCLILLGVSPIVHQAGPPASLVQAQVVLSSHLGK